MRLSAGPGRVTTPAMPSTSGEARSVQRSVSEGRSKIGRASGRRAPYPPPHSGGAPPAIAIAATHRTHSSGVRRGFLPRGLCDTCPQVVANRYAAACAGRCPTTLNRSSRRLPQTRRRKPVIQPLTAATPGRAGRPTGSGRSTRSTALLTVVRQILGIGHRLGGWSRSSRCGVVDPAPISVALNSSSRSGRSRAHRAQAVRGIRHKSQATLRAIEAKRAA